MIFVRGVRGVRGVVTTGGRSSSGSVRSYSGPSVALKHRTLNCTRALRAAAAHLLAYKYS